MSFETYYISSSGQPRNNLEQHATLDAALEAWQSNCGALLAGSGGKSVMIDADDGEELVWQAYGEGGYVCGAMADRMLDAMADEDKGTPAKVVAAIQRSWRPSYSPPISAELTIHGERYQVGSLGPDGVVVRSPKKCPPGRGVVRLTVDGRVTEYHYDFYDGIDPDRDEQPVALIKRGDVA